MRNQCIINPERSRGEPELPPVGIFAVNPTDAASLSVLAKKENMQRSFLFNSNLYHSAHLFLAGPAVGAPMAVMCLEKLIALGAKKIILYGWCGSLHEGLQAMDIFIPTDALSEEGTSAHYQFGKKNEITSSLPLRSNLNNILSSAELDFQQGKIWTTDAPYRETDKKVGEYAAKGVYGVDMEYSALCTVAAFRGVEFAAMMLVSDELWRPAWKPQYSFKKFKKKSRNLLTLLYDAVNIGI
ncbi:MAG: phosphorylase [Candidatus Electrothrix sp. AR3]|nr:phosphorylase [Candidatus Electrothrix sp. AR3]